MNDLLDVMEVEEVDEINSDRRLLEDRMDPFRLYDEGEFIRRYRLSKETTHSLIQRLQERFEPAVNFKGKNTDL